MRHWKATDGDEREHIGTSRRRLLSSLGSAAAVGLAGCGGSESNDGGAPATDEGGEATDQPMDEGGGATDQVMDEGGGGATTESATPTSGGGPATCSDLVGEYAAFDPGEHPLTVRGERPAALSNITYASPPGFNIQMRVPDPNTAPYPKLLRITQSAYKSRGQYEEPYAPGETREGVSIVEFEFAGETLQATLSASGGSNTVGTRLPYEFDDGKRYVTTRLLYRVFVGNDGTEIGPDCPENVESSFMHVLNSLEPNPATTIQAATDEYSR
ncbi:hypothetical protein [Haloarcula montana]|uniref:hypothetical protein n=1 Tax=Haloarcula montana TaxID=3111776 RepID=UPI002D79F879|nr:hypothetical protein [Haloarcula sp. GH36]